MIPEEFTIRLRPRSILKIFVLSPLVIVPAGLIWMLPWGAPAAPAWVQAVGSVLAIFVAIAVPRHQRKTEVAEHRAQEMDRERLLALRLCRNAIDICNFAIQTQRAVQAGAQPNGNETALFERYLDSVIECFEQETDKNRAEIASYIRGVLIILIYDLQDHGANNEFLAVLSEAVDNLKKYRDQAKSALALIPDSVVE